MIEWLISQLFYMDQCGPAAVNWTAWAILFTLFGSSGVFLGGVVSAHFSD